MIQKSAGTIKSDFVHDGQSYLQYLIGEVLRQAGISPNIIKGLAAFDPSSCSKGQQMLLSDILICTFLHHSWVTSANESACRDEYVEPIDKLRANYPPSFIAIQSSRDLIDILINLEFMQSHKLLLNLIQLSCQCETSNNLTYPAVTVGSINTSVYNSRCTDVILPGQRYLSGIPCFFGLQ